MAERIVFHIDVNSAFLSWTAAHRMCVLGDGFDLRTVPSVVAGDKKSRHSIILAKSGPAKKFGIQTGEPLGKAMEKCPNLVVVEPDYELYVTASRSLIAMLREYSPLVEQFSIDEAWIDMTGTTGLYGPPVLAADRLRERIHRELGFTVNIGISCNKLLAKMAGDFEKPDKTHTLFPAEIPAKLWPLPVRELFMLGPATERRLNRIGIHTIGELAQADPELVLHYLNKPGLALWHSANGRCSEELLAQPEANKGYGNSTTLPADVTTEAGAQRVLLSLCETVAMRLRRDGKAARCISVSLRSADFVTFSHQTMLREAVHGTEELFRCACRVFAEAWDGQTPLRQLGVQATRLEELQPRQLDLFAVGGAQQYARKAILDGTVDALREKYGEGVIRRARFTGADTVLAGGLSRERRTGITKPLDAE